MHQQQDAAAQIEAARAAAAAVTRMLKPSLAAYSLNATVPSHPELVVGLPLAMLMLFLNVLPSRQPANYCEIASEPKQQQQQ